MKPSIPYFRVCQFFFVLACCVGSNFALSYLDLIQHNNWAAWRPGIGIALLFISMVLSFVGYGLNVQRASRHIPPTV